MKKKGYVIVLFVITSIICCQSALACFKSHKDDFVITGYLNSNWINQKTNLEFIPYLDRIFFFGMSPDADGNFVVTDKYINNYKLVRSKLKKGQEILLVIGGGGLVANMHTMGNDSIKREEYIKKVTDFAIKYDFDGIDIDWETDRTTGVAKYVPTENLIALINGIKKRTPKGFIITASMHNSSVQQTLDIYPLLEDVNLRFYASLNKEGLQAPLYTVKEGLEKFERKNVPASKLLVGLSFYGRSPDRGTIYYRDIVDNLELGDTITNIYKEHSFNSVADVREKIKFFKEKGYKGVMIWELTQDAPYSHPMSLLRAIYNESKKVKKNK
ncbi:MAG: glycoside hydrolase family 18 protein [Bacteroidales bacterium]|nr:glycoside hydrolase family 18 protein [Bacteroidales bacterium]